MPCADPVCVGEGGGGGGRGSLNSQKYRVS